MSEGPDADMVARMDWVANEIVQHSVRMLPKDIWDRYKGNIAIDATKIEIMGSPNPSKIGVDRRNCDPFSGRYRREGSHGGIGAATDVAAYELETAVMAWNKPGENQLFPTLVTAIGFHSPGKLGGHGLKLVQWHQKLGFTRHLTMADRAYNAGLVEEFHLPTRKMGVELVIDYPKNRVGNQGHYEDLIMVDGNWFVNWMPADLIDASPAVAKLYEEVEKAEDAIQTAEFKGNKATLTERRKARETEKFLETAGETAAPLVKNIDARTPYRMIAHGLPDEDGWQRFTYPDPEGMLHIPTSGARQGTISIPPRLNPRTGQAASKGEPLKHLQKFQWATDTWRRYYGMRSLVESSNQHLKDPRKEDLGNKHKRPGRGPLHHYMASAFAVASSNMRRILTFIREEAAALARAAGGKLPRRRRRKDPYGNALPKPNFNTREYTPPRRL